MTEVEITADHLRRLGIKLMGLQHQLTPDERTILWGALAVASDVLTQTTTEPGKPGLVKRDSGEGIRLEVDDRYRATVYLDADFPDALARSFHPEKQDGGNRSVENGQQAKISDGANVRIP